MVVYGCIVTESVLWVLPYHPKNFSFPFLAFDECLQLDCIGLWWLIWKQRNSTTYWFDVQIFNSSKISYPMHTGYLGQVLGYDKRTSISNKTLFGCGGKCFKLCWNLFEKEVVQYGDISSIHFDPCSIITSVFRAHLVQVFSNV